MQLNRCKNCQETTIITHWLLFNAHLYAAPTEVSIHLRPATACNGTNASVQMCTYLDFTHCRKNNVLFKCHEKNGICNVWNMRRQWNDMHNEHFAIALFLFFSLSILRSSIESTNVFALSPIHTHRQNNNKRNRFIYSTIVFFRLFINNLQCLCAHAIISFELKSCI